MSERLFDLSPAGVSHDLRGERNDPRAYQRIIRDRETESDPKPTRWAAAQCSVKPIPRRAAQRIIVRYEWLGHMRGVVQACYGLIAPDGDILGAVVFGQTANRHSGDICGTPNRALTICLRRGACVHYAPPNAASYLISHACKAAASDHGWRVFHAYADDEAGEIGTVYQACNWHYIGRSNGGLAPLWLGPGREYPIDQSALLKVRGWTPTEARNNGWRDIKVPRKHRYFHLEGSKTERRNLMRSLRYEVLPFPKRAPA